MFKRLDLLSTLVLMLGAVACSSDEKSPGGEGADVDLTGYYTKTEVDAALAAMAEAATAAATAVAPVYEPASPAYITAKGYANKQPANGWAVPAGARSALLRVSVYTNTPGQRIAVAFGASENDYHFPLEAKDTGDYQTYYHFVSVRDDQSPVYAWQPEEYAFTFGTSVDSYTVIPVVWLK